MARGPFAAGSSNPSANPSRVDTLDEYLQRLASQDPVPGGGSAAALVAALAAALVAMVGRIVTAPPDGLVSSADRLREELTAARLRDEAAFAAVIAAQALPKDNDAARSARRGAIESALRQAAQAPLRAAALALDVLKLDVRLLDAKAGALASDVGCAAEFAYAALAGCAYNVRINHRYMHDAAAITQQAAILADYEREGTEIFERVRAAVAQALIKK
jgi:formiminotetrahydrofolate cyclodeaminase